jgi:hypothetical protein
MHIGATELLVLLALAVGIAVFLTVYLVLLARRYLRVREAELKRARSDE